MMLDIATVARSADEAATSTDDTTVDVVCSNSGQLCEKHRDAEHSSFTSAGPGRMIWVLLAMLGVPIWLVVGALGGAVISRRRLQGQDDVFAVSRRAHGEDDWPRRPAFGRHVHDVLLVNSGLARVRTEVLAVDHLEVGRSPAGRDLSFQQGIEAVSQLGGVLGPRAWRRAPRHRRFLARVW